MVKKATPRYVAEPYASSRFIDKGFGGICATLSGGNPPRYETNHMQCSKCWHIFNTGRFGRYAHCPKCAAKHAGLWLLVFGVAVVLLCMIMAL
jgi:hypothetical protein